MESTELRGLLEEQLRLSRRLRARIRELEAGRDDRLAVVGMAVRFPGGVTSPEEYWELLSGDGTAIGDVPDERPGLATAYHPEVGRPGRSYVKRAGFLSGVADFDADFFGISHREAEALDPQQRLLLETSWEALERAGIAVRRADRLDAGVFVGIMAAEYVDRLAAGPMDRLDPYFGTGGGHCFAAGRISYAFGLRGPALSIDTACSSSLVALHTAVRSLRARECRYALVGGANLLFSPQLMVSLCQSRALAPDGRCKPFTAAADGYGRGEGVAVLVLMRLDDALAEVRPVLAVVRGSAVNHDGASSGLTVPSGPAQREVIRSALVDAGVAADEVSYVEAHGTGTSLGDPIEAGALSDVFGSGGDRPADPLPVGSVKARIGHLEAAAGMAGLVKLVLMLRHEQIPVDVPEADGALNPLIPWHENGLEIPRRARRWSGPHRVAGISAFGLSGTNAHAVLEAAPAPPGPAAAEPRTELLVLSARTEPALQALAAKVSTYLFRADPNALGSVCHTLRVGRTPLARRLAVTGTTTRELAQKVGLAATATPPVASGAPPIASGAPGTAGDAAAAVPGPADPAGPALRTAVLTTTSTAPDALAEGVAAIASDLPRLADDGAVTVADPAGWLVGALKTLGIVVRTRTDRTERPATLEYGGRTVDVVPAEPGRATEVFLAALGALYCAGAELRMEPLGAPGSRFLPDLPTYPFQRRRFWIDEPDPSRQAHSAEPLAAAAPAGTAAPADAVASDLDSVERFLRTELSSALGATDELDLRLSFAELGGDSFTAMLFVKSVEDRYQAENLVDDFAVDQPVSDLLAGLAHTITRLSRPDGRAVR